MLHPCDNMLLRIAQADACAASVEFVKRDRYPELYNEALKLERYIQHPTHTKLAAGRYTDDTAMSIGVAEVMLKEPTVFSAQSFADAWVDVFKRDYRVGYSRAFQAFLESIKSGDEFLAKIRPDSKKNGAAMRVVPIGLLPDLKEVIRVADFQAKITHNTPEGRACAIRVAIMSHLSYHTEDGLDGIGYRLRDALNEYTEFKDDDDEETYEFPAWMGGSVACGLDTAFAVEELLSVPKENNSLMRILKTAMEWGGDTDSVASIAWGIAAPHFQDEALPEFLESCLEPYGKYGAVFLKDLGTQLMKRYA